MNHSFNFYTPLVQTISLLLILQCTCVICRNICRAACNAPPLSGWMVTLRLKRTKTNQTTKMNGSCVVGEILRVEIAAISVSSFGKSYSGPPYATEDSSG